MDGNDIIDYTIDYIYIYIYTYQNDDMIMMIASTLVSLLLVKVGDGQIRFHPLEGLLGWWVKIRTVHSPRDRKVEDLT